MMKVGFVVSEDIDRTNEVKKRSRWKIAAAAVATALALAVGTTFYFGAVHAYALPGVSVASKSVLGMDEAEIAALVKKRAEETTVTIDVEGQQIVAALADLGVSVDAEGTAREAMGLDKSAFGRVGSVFSEESFSPIHSLDNDVLNAYAAQFVTPAVNSTLEYSEETGGFVPTASQPGTGIDSELLASTVREAVDTLTPQSVSLPLQQTLPTVTEDATAPLVEQANALLSPEVTLTGSRSDIAAEQAEKAAWVQLPVTDGVVGAPTYDEAKVREWVQKVADETSVHVVNPVNNVNEAGELLVEGPPGQAGTEASNVDVVVADLMNALAAQQPYTGALEYVDVQPTFSTQVAMPGYENFAYPAAEGERWIDVNLSTYQMIPYVGQTPEREPSPIVHGKPGHETVTGTFHVYLKFQAQDMGCHDPYPYCARGVPWVSYFSGNFALHAAPWQPTFGPDAPGSAGCVNLPTDVAEWVYGWAPLGTPVVVHY